MKLCKKLIAVIIAAAMVFSIFTFSSLAEKAPEVPEGYDGVVVMSAEAYTLGLGCIIPPTYVPYHEGETVADISMRLFEDYGLAYSAGNPDSFPAGFALTELEYPNMHTLELDVPDYLMEQLIANYCYDEEEGWDQAEPENDILAQGNYTYYSGWMYSDNDVTPSVGAGECPVEEGHVYRWMYSIYGYGMDIGMSDGWGYFPEFDNPAMGVQRSEAYTLFADIFADDDLIALIGAGAPAHEEYAAFHSVVMYLGSTQEEIDAATEALAAALAQTPEIVPGDVDGNGEVTATDAITILRAAMNIVTLEGDAAAAADFDGNGVIAVSDALLAMRTAMGLLN